MSNHLLQYPSHSALHGPGSALPMPGGQSLTPSQCMALSALLQSGPQRPDMYHPAFGHGLLAGFNPSRLGMPQSYPPAFSAASAAAAAAAAAASGDGGSGPANGGERGSGHWPHFHP
jgi:hypothetical protein